MKELKFIIYLDLKYVYQLDYLHFNFSEYQYSNNLNELSKHLQSQDFFLNNLKIELNHLFLDLGYLKDLISIF